MMTLQFVTPLAVAGLFVDSCARSIKLEGSKEAILVLFFL